MKLQDAPLRAQYKQAKRDLFRRMFAQFQGGWNKSDHLPFRQEPQLAGRQAIANLLDSMSLPCGYEVYYKGTQRQSGLGGHGISEGELQYQVAVRSRSGAKHFIDVPVNVRGGTVETPSVMFYSNTPMIIAQSSFNRIIEAAEFKEKIPARPNMFAYPQAGSESLGEVYRWQRGIRAQLETLKDSPSTVFVLNTVDSSELFKTTEGVMERLDELRRSSTNVSVVELSVSPNVRNQLQEGPIDDDTLYDLMSEQADQIMEFEIPYSKYAEAEADIIDTTETAEVEEVPDSEYAEQIKSFYPSQEVKLVKGMDFITRGGARFHLDSGTKGAVVRSTNDGVIVAFENSFTFRVPFDAVS